MLFVWTDGEGGRAYYIFPPGFVVASDSLSSSSAAAAALKSRPTHPTDADGRTAARGLSRSSCYTQECDFVATVVVDSSTRRQRARSSPEAFVKEDERGCNVLRSRAATSLLRCCLLLSDHQSPESFCHCTVASVPPSLLCVKGAVFSGGSRISCSRASRAEQSQRQRQLLLLIFPICGGTD